MTKVLLDCKNCKGTGKEPPNKFIGLLTFGIMYILEKTMPRECPECWGSGKRYYKVRR